MFGPVTGPVTEYDAARMTDTDRAFPIADGRALGGYRPCVDFFRLAAAFCILLFHAHVPGFGFDHAAVGFFTIAAAYFAAQPSHLTTFDGALRARTRRILRPFAIWLAIYAAAIIAKALIFGLSPLDRLMIWAPPDGTFFQLWFLPFVFLVSMAAFASAPLLTVMSRTDAGFAGLMAAAALVSAAALAVWNAADPPTGLGVFLLYAPSAAIGIALGHARGSGERLIAAAAAAVALGVALAAFGLDGTDQFVFGAPLMALALAAPSVRPDLARAAGDLALGVFLVHALMLSAVETGLGVPVSTPFGAAIASALSLGAAAVIRKSSLRRHLL